MSRVVIIGGGFAGLAAVRRVSRVRGVDCTVIDRKDALDFLPMIPELLSRRVDPRLLRYDLADLARRTGFRFVRAEVTSVDLDAKRVATDGGAHPFDFLVIASGSVTDFHGRDDLASSALAIDSVADALRMREAALRDDVDTVVIVGGGYTGIEVATHLRRAFDRCGRDTRILVVERGPRILASLPRWQQDYVARNLLRMNIDVARGTSLETFVDGVATLADGRRIPRACLVWAAGVRTGDFLQHLDAPHARQGRLVVDEYLRLLPPLPPGGEGWGEGRERRTGGKDDFANGDGVHPNIFVAGDAAGVLARDGRPMRMAVQISLDEGTVAGENVVRAIRGRPLVKYRPLDLGWVVPMANFRSCGTALGLGVRGFPAIMLHYAMCLFRSIGLGRRVALVTQLLQRRR